MYDPIANRPVGDTSGLLSLEIAPGDLRLVEIVLP